MISLSLKKSLPRSWASVVVAATLFTFRPARVGAVTIETPRISADGTIALFIESGFCKELGCTLGNRLAKLKAANKAPAPERSTLTPPDLMLVMTKHHD